MPGPAQLLTTPWAVRPGRIGGALPFPSGARGAPLLPAPGPAVTAPAMLPGNLISPADSDFETTLAGSNWNVTNCTVAVSTARSFSGGRSLAVTAVATGNVAITQNMTFPFPGLPSAGYVVSGYAQSPNAGRTGQAQLKCINAGFTTASDISGPVIGLAAGAWTPLQAAIASPPFTAWVAPQVTITGMLAGETIWLDLVYAAPSGVQVLVAWGTGPFSATPLFADMTPFTRTDAPISMFHGRQDNLSEVQPGQLTLTLSNDLGWLTEQNTASPFYPNIKLGRRIQVSEPDETGAWHVRFDGQVNDIELLPAPTGLTADALVQGSDVIAFLQRQQGLAPWTKEEILADSPALHWTLDDPAGSSVAVESSGNQGPALQLHSYGTAGTYAFAGGTASTGGIQNGMESQTWPGVGTPAAFPSVYFKQQAGGSARTSQANWQLQAALPVTLTPGTSSCSIEAFAILDMANQGLYTNAAAYTFWLFSLADPRTGSYIGANVQLVTGSPTLQFVAVLPSGLVNLAAIAISLAPGPLDIAITMTKSGAQVSVSCYLNGTLIGGATPIANLGLAFSYLTVGGPWSGYQGWLGQVSCVSIYDFTLSTGRMVAHYNRALSGAYAQLPGQVISAIAGYAGVPAFWNNVGAGAGLSGIDYFSLAGQNGLASMQSVEQADGGVLYADIPGRLTYAGRETRMGAGAPSLTLQSGQYEPDLGYKMNDQFLQNESGLSSAGISTGIGAVNAQSQLDYGEYAPNGTAQSPQSVPLLTFNSWYQSYLNAPGGIAGAFSADNLTFAAQWAANSHAQPSPKAASARIDMLTLPQSGPDGIAPSRLYALDMNSVIALNGLPQQFPNVPHANEYFVEGVSETIQGGVTPVHDLVIYTSPASQGRAWIAGDPVYGKLDSTAVIGRSAVPAPAAVPAFEFAGAVYPGPPYYPPSYGTPMNTTGFVGDLDQAGIWANLQQQLRPPMGIAAIAAAPQSIANATGAFPAGAVRLIWDTVYVDTLGGFGWLAGFGNWYFCLVPGWWQLYAVANFAFNGTGRRAAWFQVGQRAAKGGTGPVSGLNNIGPAEVQSSGNYPTGVPISAKIYCTLGTAISVQVWQNSGGALNTATTRGGCLFAARFLGDTATED